MDRAVWLEALIGLGTFSASVEADLFQSTLLVWHIEIIKHLLGVGILKIHNILFLYIVMNKISYVKKTTVQKYLETYLKNKILKKVLPGQFKIIFTQYCTAGLNRKMGS